MDQEVPTTSNSYGDAEDERSSFIMELAAAAVADAKPCDVFITDLHPLICQNNGCSKPLKVPIRQCLSGHLFCFDCHHGHVKCLLCPQEELYPATSVDDILNNILDVCQNNILGCKQKFPFYELYDHVSERCKFRED